MFHGLGDGLDDFLFDLVQNLADGDAGDLCGARRTRFGQSEGEGSGRLRGDQFDREDDELRDDGDLAGEYGDGGRVESQGDGLGGDLRVPQIVVGAGAAGEGAPFLGESVDGFTRVRPEHLVRRRRALRGRLFDLRGEGAPGLGALEERVLVGLRPVVPEESEDPGDLARQCQ
ncbi:hypothetical protein [Streptomyces sp. Ac-502]|uniref:hypothetical protein n=1 Tax=Streptomyces sp. Ac-502 TaxID=3342801 RepID=UPI003862B853